MSFITDDGLSFITDDGLDPLDDNSLTITLPEVVDGEVLQGILGILHRRGFEVTLRIGQDRDDVPVIDLHCERGGTNTQH